MIYLMNENTGSVDTKENWYQEFKSSEYCEWFGYESEEEMKRLGVYDTAFWDEMLVEVKKDKEGNWVEV